MKVAYQGERGSFSESAARRLLGPEMTGVPCRSFEEMFTTVGAGEADCCITPIENSLAGSIHRNYDLLLESQLTIAGETSLRIAHNLIAPPDVGLDDIRRVYSHPVALAQCSRFFSKHPQIESMPVHDTAGAVCMIMERGRRDEAGIASANAAKIYGGKVILENIEDNAQNFTRFFLLVPPERAASVVPRDTPRRWKTSIVFRVANKPGASSVPSARLPSSRSTSPRSSHVPSKVTRGSTLSISISPAAATTPTSRARSIACGRWQRWFACWARIRHGGELAVTKGLLRKM